VREGDFGEERLGVEDPEDLESDDDLRLGLGRTQPVDDIESEGALFECLCLMLLADEGFFALRLWLEWARFSGYGVVGTNAREDRDSLLDSWSKVLMASMRDALERFIRAV
jgi:hypothetical protein